MSGATAPSEEMAPSEPAAATPGAAERPADETRGEPPAPTAGAAQAPPAQAPPADATAPSEVAAPSEPAAATSGAPYPSDAAIFGAQPLRTAGATQAPPRRPSKAPSASAGAGTEDSRINATRRPVLTAMFPKAGFGVFMVGQIESAVPVPNLWAIEWTVDWCGWEELLVEMTSGYLGTGKEYTS